MQCMHTKLMILVYWYELDTSFGVDRPTPHGKDQLESATFCDAVMTVTFYLKPSTSSN